MRYFSSVCAWWLRCRPALALLVALLGWNAPLPGRAQNPAPAWEAVLAPDQLLGGLSQVRGTAVNAAGDVFVTGNFSGQVAFGATILTTTIGPSDVFVAKWNTAAGSWAWAVAGGGTSSDQGMAIAVSGTSVYVTGFITNSSTNANAVQFGGITLNGASTASNTDVFVAKYTDAGSSATYNWAVAAGGTGSDQGTGIALNGTSVYLTGSFTNSSANANAVQFGSVALNGTSATAGVDVFVARYTDGGSSATYNWATAGGGTGADLGYGVAANGTSVYVTGVFVNSSSNANVVKFGGATLNGTNAAASTDVFVVKYTDAGSSATYNWATAGGGAGADQGNGIAVSGTGVFVTGYFNNGSTNANAVQFGGATLNGASSTNSQDVFVVKYTDAGSSATYRWSAAGGGTAADLGNGIAVSGTGVFVTGYFSNTSTNASAVQFGGTTLNGAGSILSIDVFVAKYTDATTSATYNWATAGGGDGGGDVGTSLAVSGSRVEVGLGTGAAAARVGAVLLPPSAAARASLNPGTGAFQDAAAPRVGGTSQVRATAINSGGDVLVTGSFTGQVTFGTTSLFSAGSTDVFLAKWNTAAGSWTWAVSGGGFGADQGNGVAVTGTEMFVTGFITNTSTNANSVKFGGAALNGASTTSSQDVLTVKYSDNGSSTIYQWATVGGGTGSDQGTAIAVTGTSVYVTGSITNTSANANSVVFGPYTLNGTSATASTDVFLAKYLDGITFFNYGWFLAGGGSGADQGNGVTSSGSNVFVTGSFTNTSTNAQGVQFGGTALNGASTTSSPDVFVAKYTDTNTNTYSYMWAVAGGGSGADQGNGVAVSGSSVYVTGSITNTSANASAVQFGGAALNGASSTSSLDVFVTKYLDNGSSATYRWAAAGGGGGADQANGVAANGANVYVTGTFTNTSTNASAVTFGGVALNGASTTSSPDAFLVKYLDAGTSSAYKWATSGGGAGADQANGVAVKGVQVVTTGAVVPPATFGTFTVSGASTGVGVGAILYDRVLLSSISPSSGPVGISVTLTGINFTGATVVTFGGSSNNTVTSPTVNGTGIIQTITVTVPAGATAGSVTVTTPLGVSNGLTYTVTALATVTTAPPGSVTSSGATLGGNVTNEGGVTVTERGVVYSTTATTPTTADTKVPIGSGPGTFSQAVSGLSSGTLYYVRAYAINSIGTSYGAGQQFTTPTPPTINSFTPPSGPVGTTVTVDGTYFIGVTAVKLNGVAITGYTVVNSTTITFIVPSGASSGSIAVTTPGGTAFSLYDYIVTLPVPTITSFTPPTGPIGTSVTVTGTNFTGATAVKLNGTSVPGYTVVNATTITFTVPGGASSGLISVTTPGGTATSTSSFTIAAPTITSFTPTTGSVGTVVTVTGTNFTGATSVTLNGVTVTGYTVVNPTTITFTVPSGTASGTVSVTTPGGTATSTSSFTVVPPLLISSTSPVANARAGAAGGPVSVTFSQAVTSGSTAALHVFSAQRGGRRSGSSGSTSASGATVSFAPTYGFRPGETVQATVTTAATTPTGTSLLTPRVFQFTAAAGIGPAVFVGTGNPAVGDGPLGVALGDVDGDGDLDMLTANRNNANVSVLFNNGSGTYSGTTSVAAGLRPTNLALGDLDGDGDLDLVVANANSDSVSVHFNNGSGGFGRMTPATSLAVPATPMDVALGDLDGDGDLDLAVACAGGQRLAVSRNNGSGSFGSLSLLPPGGSPQSVALGDVDGDGDLDLAYADRATNAVGLFRNDGSGGFGSGYSVAVGSSPRNVALGDVDGDGDLDFVTANNGDNTVSVRLNNGSGSFGGSAAVAVADRPMDVALGDVDGDGDLDFVTANYLDDVVSLRLNDGSGTFSGSTDVSTGDGPNSVALADIDGDGDLDMLTANREGSTAGVRFNQAPTPTITSFTPPSGPVGTSVTVTGTYFIGVTALRLNGVAITGYTVVNPTTITFIVPSGATSGLISVTTPVGTATSTGSYTVTVPLLITSTSPVANAQAGSASGPVSVTFSQAVTSGSMAALKVFSAQRGGRRSGSSGSTTASGATVSFAPTYNFKPGETVRATVTTAATATAGATLAAPRVFQFTAAAGVGPGTFIDGVSVGVGAVPFYLAVGDADGDGDLDLFSANRDANSVSVRLNNGSGTFSGSTDVSVGSTPERVVLGDVDGDGDLDLVTANRNDYTASVRLNNGSGGFSGSQEVAVNYVAYGVALGDVDGDGDLDLVTAGNDFELPVQGASIRLNDGTGTFGGGSDLEVGIDPQSVTLGDVDGDGDLDMAISNYNGGTVNVRLNDGTGTFGGGSDVSVGSATFEVVLGDVDGDNDLDLVSASASNDNVSIRLNNGSGAFSGTQDVPVGVQPRSVALGDVDGDGDLDLLATSSDAGRTVSVRVNNGSGSFSGTQDVPMGDETYGLATGDIDGDGDLDLLAALYTNDAVRIVFNKAPPLPVELVSFTARAKGAADAALIWRTASERNAAHWNIERSATGRDFVRFAQVAAQGSKPSPTDYALTDAHAASYSPTVYYRLQQVDADGTTAYSPVQVVRFGQAAPPAFSLYPNPSGAHLTLDLKALPPGTYQVTLADLAGRTVYSDSFAAGLAHGLELPRLASGPYLVLVHGTGDQAAIRLRQRLLKE